MGTTGFDGLHQVYATSCQRCYLKRAKTPIPWENNWWKIVNPGKVLLEILTEDINGYLASVKGISSTHLLHPAITTIASANISSSVGSRVEPHLSECPSPLKQRRRGLGGDH